jgi:DNA-binding PadR family transcriptional regulator
LERARYSITDAGRQALAAWLVEEPASPALQFEGLLKVLFADHGPPGTNQAILAAIGSWAREARAEAEARARGYLDADYIEGIDFAERAAIVAQAITFLAELYDLIDRWSQWSAELADASDRTDRAQHAFTAIAQGRRALQ